MISIDLHTNADGSLDGRYRLGGKPALPWQLPTANFISAKMPLVAVYPRPDTETTAAEYPRNAHQGIEYKIPLAVQGGAWPFYYELVAAPSGATLGETYGSVDYGVLKWTPVASSGSESFHVRVHDQDGNTVDMQWSATIGTDWVRFIDPVNGLDTNDGSISAPFQTLQHAFNNLTGGKHVCLRQGTHSWGGGSLLNTVVLGMFGYTGETATIDADTVTSSAVFWLNHHGHTIQDLTFVNSPTTPTNPRWFSSLQTHNRVAMTFCNFLDGRKGTEASGGNDNNSCLFLGNGGAIREYITQSHCTFSGLERTGNGFSAIDTYSCKYLVCHSNTFADTALEASRHVIWIKGGGNTYITVRENHFSEAWSGSGGALLSAALGTDGLGSAYLSGYQEFCYNTLISQNTTASSHSAIQIGSAGQAGVRPPVWFYRNTIVGIFSGTHADLEYSLLSSENDILISDISLVDPNKAVLNPQPDHNICYTHYNDPSNVFRNIEDRPSIQSLVMTGLECHKSTADGVLDANYKLQGSYRTSYLGKRGAEISA